MKSVIAKNTVYEWVFILCIIIPYFDNFELTIAVWSLAVLFTVQNKYSLGIAKQLFYFSAILGIALVVSFFKDHQFYYIIRDITYLIKPVLGLLIGYQLCQKLNTNIFRLIVYTGYVFALVHLFFLVRGFLFFSVMNINDLRYFGGFFSDFEVFALVIILFPKRFEIDMTASKIKWYTLIIATSVFLYLARTNFIQLAILFFALKGFFALNKRNITILTSFILVGIISYSTILFINPKRNGPGLEAFLYKIKIIPEEAFKTRISRHNWKELNDNYRSYENIVTYRSVTQEGTLTTLFGKGLGSKVDLKQEIQLGDMNLRFISILHNGYMTVFLKSGLVGIILLLLSFGIYFVKAKSEIPLVINTNLLLLGMGIFMIMSYWVFMGFYFKADNKVILLGMLICYREIIMANHSKKLTND
jgi:hypothetical protein